MSSRPDESVSFEPAQAQDMAAVSRIFAHYVTTSTATFEMTPPDVNGWTDKLGSITRAGWPFLVARAGDEVAGFAYVAPWRPRPAYAHTVEDTIYLDPAAIGRGIGTRLLSRLLEEAAVAGAREVVAVIADAETQASRALHQRVGFVDAGRLERVGFKFDQWLGTHLMQKTVTPPLAKEAPLAADQEDRA